ncbi:primosomal protein N' [Thiohalorhabdus methylotrophus]|uniref:Replication restart protein PriA n=1 Tax=Thiohalorhabdus methylotrophus TaxID=3242694 RepID=A0ABV4TSY8_9GAMM
MNDRPLQPDRADTSERSEAGVVRVAVPVPLRRLFDYLPPETGPAPVPGVRVRVPFRGGDRIGVVVAVEAHARVEQGRLKRVAETLDTEPLWPAPLFALLHWAAGYYHHPEGEVFDAALPGVLGRGGQPPEPPRLWGLTGAGREVDPVGLARAPRQQALLEALQDGPLSEAELRTVAPNLRPPLGRLAERGWIEARAGARVSEPTVEPEPGPELNPAQAEAVARIKAAEGFAAFLLEGVTGSGKTEVYFHAIRPVLDRGEQVLVLVPEIALTPQLLARFRRRLTPRLTVLHSGLAEGERLAGWEAARSGEAQVVIGTRSAVFTPLANPGLIVIDEEHDPSFKQQEGFRYHGRDLALARGAREAVPVVMGTATPSLESLYNAERGRFQRLHLPERAGGAQLPGIDLLDMRGVAEDGGLAPALLREVVATVERGEQALLFLNRRGYAPVLLCPGCGWTQECPHCDRPMTFHRSRRLLLCHLCGHHGPVPVQCPEADCGNPDLQTVGYGVEQVEQALARHLPDARVVRVDRDTTRRKGSLESKLDAIQSGQAQVIVGTQMVVKGHHFPGVTLVGVVAADGGLYSADFRARERLFQQILQVAGRAGRAERPGRVWVQTFHPEHPVFEPLKAHDYNAFAEMELAERRAAILPPFAPLALLRSEAPDADAANGFLEAAREMGRSQGVEGVRFLGPAPAPVERLEGRSRAQLLVTAPDRKALHRALAPWAPGLESIPAGRDLRWSLDVDPADLF